MDSFKKSRRVPKKLLSHFPLSEEELQCEPLQMPGEMRPGNFKVPTKALGASSPGRPEAGAAPVGLRSCGVDAVPQSRPGLDEPLVPSWRGHILTVSCPGAVSTTWERPWCGSSTEQGAVGPAVLLRGAGYPTSHHARPSQPALALGRRTTSPPPPHCSGS